MPATFSPQTFAARWRTRRMLRVWSLLLLLTLLPLPAAAQPSVLAQAAPITIQPPLSYQGHSYTVSYRPTGSYREDTPRFFYAATATSFAEKGVSELLVRRDGAAVTDKDELRQVFTLYNAAFLLYQRPGQNPSASLSLNFRADLELAVRIMSLFTGQLVTPINGPEENALQALRGMLTPALKQPAAQAYAGAVREAVAGGQALQTALVDVQATMKFSNDRQVREIATRLASQLKDWQPVTDQGKAYFDIGGGRRLDFANGLDLISLGVDFLSTGNLQPERAAWLGSYQAVFGAGQGALDAEMARAAAKAQAESRQTWLEMADIFQKFVLEKAIGALAGLGKEELTRILVKWSWDLLGKRTLGHAAIQSVAVAQLVWDIGLVLYGVEDLRDNLRVAQRADELHERFRDGRLALVGRAGRADRTTYDGSHAEAYQAAYMLEALAASQALRSYADGVEATQKLPNPGMLYLWFRGQDWRAAVRELRRQADQMETEAEEYAGHPPFVDIAVALARATAAGSEGQIAGQRPALAFIGADGNIWLNSGESTTQLTNDRDAAAGRVYESLAASPTDGLIAAVEAAPGRALVLAKTDGSAPQVLATEGTAFARWSPDGRKLAYTQLKATGTEAAMGAVVVLEAPNLQPAPNGARFLPFDAADAFDWLGSDQIVYRASKTSKIEAYGLANSQTRAIDVAPGWTTPIASRDGLRLAIQRVDDAGRLAIQVMDAGGKAPQTLRTFDIRAYLDWKMLSVLPFQLIAWSPTNQMLAVSVPGGPEKGVWICDLSTGKWDQVYRAGQEQMAQAPVFSPDGGWLAFGLDGEVSVMNLTTRQVEGVAQGASPQWVSGAGGGSVTRPDATPTAGAARPTPRSGSAANGEIAYVMDGDIWLGNLAGEPAKRLTTDGHSANPAWSPDGQWLAFASNRGGNFDIYRMHADGSGQAQVTNTRQDEILPSFSSVDGSLWFFRLEPGGDGHYDDYAILSQNLPSGPAERIYEKREAYAPCRPGRLSVGPGGEVAVSEWCGTGAGITTWVLLLKPAGRGFTATPLASSYAPSFPDGACKGQAHNTFGARWAPRTARLALLESTDCYDFVNGTVPGKTALILLDFQAQPPLNTSLMAANNRAARATPDREHAFAWSPDEKQLVITTGSGLSLINSDGSQLRSFAAAGADPAWRPLPQPSGAGTPVPTPGSGPRATATPRARPTQTPVPPEGSLGDIGPKSVWVPSPEAQQRIMDQCPSGASRVTCVASVMRSFGASAEALAFYSAFTQVSDRDGFLTSFKEAGKVDLAGVVDPFSARGNYQHLMVNGTPKIVFADEASLLNQVEQSAGYAALHKRYPQLISAGLDPLFAGQEPRQGGGQRFTFHLGLANGCLGCAVVGVAQIVCDFDQGGRFLGRTVLSVAEAGPSGTESSAVPTDDGPPAVGDGGRVQTEDIGRSVQGETIKATRIGRGPRIVVIAGTIHGNEDNTAALVEALSKEFANQSELAPAGVTLYFVPVLNPDGLLAQSRFNAHGVDLNRNWQTPNWQTDTVSPSGTVPGGGGPAPFSEPETVALSTWLARLGRESAGRLLVLSYEAAYPPSGLVQPGYRIVNRKQQTDTAAAAVAKSFAGKLSFLYSPTWTAYPITGEMINWCAEQSISCLDIELPSHNTLSEAQLQQQVGALVALLR